MLMTYITYVIAVQHIFEAHQLGNKYAVLSQGLGSIRHELIRIFHVIKHADSSNHFCFFPDRFPVTVHQPEIMDKVSDSLASFLFQIISWFYSYGNQARNLI